jgi:hypothetical protein
LSNAVLDAPAAAEKRIVRHLMDRGDLIQMGADLNDQTLIDEYFEYRETFGRPGVLDHATLHRLVVEQNRRKAKAAKPKG